MINFADDPGGNQFQQAASKLVESVALKVSEAKNKWISDIAKKLMPDHVVAWAESGDKHLQNQARRWISKKGFHTQEHPDGRCRFLQGNKVLAEFRIVMADGKVTFESKNYDK